MEFHQSGAARLKEKKGKKDEKSSTTGKRSCERFILDNLGWRCR